MLLGLHSGIKITESIKLREQNYFIAICKRLQLIGSFYPVIEYEKQSETEHDEPVSRVPKHHRE